jgi:hypothetical protein
MKNQIKTIEELNQKINNDQIDVSPSMKEEIKAIMHYTLTIGKNLAKREELLHSHLKNIDQYKQDLLQNKISGSKLDKQVMNICNMHNKVDKVKRAIAFEMCNVQDSFDKILQMADTNHIEFSDRLVAEYQIKNQFTFISFIS